MSINSKHTDASLVGTFIAAGLLKPPRSSEEVEAEQMYSVQEFMAMFRRQQQAAIPATTSSAKPIVDECQGELFGEPVSNEVATTMRMPTSSKERTDALLAVVGDAFRMIRGRASTDMVLIDPVLNESFLTACRTSGLAATDLQFNLSLLYGRKQKRFGEMERAERFSIDDDRLNEFLFASEIAVRQIREHQYRNFERKLSLDTILCDPKLRAVFDDYAARLAPGDFRTMEYRWGALRLRKSNRALSGLPKLQDSDLDDVGVTRDVRLSALPKNGGVYCFKVDGKPIYFGQTDSLRRQIERHIEVAGFGIIPEWLTGYPQGAVRLELAAMPGINQLRREAVKGLKVNAIQPSFNWLREYPLFAA